MNRFVVVSGDSHVGLPPAQYRPYFDPQYREHLDDYIVDNEIFYSLCRKLGYPPGADVLEIIDPRGAMLTGGVAGYFDPKRRLQEIDAEGVVAEILHPGGPISLSPLFDNATSPVSPELRAAGARAYNRFLDEFCSFDRARLLGVPPVYPWPDIEAAVSTVYWAKEQGMAAIYVPRMAGAEKDLPPLFDRYWDPFWSVLEETGLPGNIHAGWGHGQGAIMDLIRRAIRRSQARSGSADGGVAESLEDVFQARRPLWQLMWGGVFDRFPALRVVFSEIRADWIPATLAHLDRRHETSSDRLALKPSEYWRRNCAVTATFMRPSDIAAKGAIGVQSILFGTDYPHIESTWPNTIDFLRYVLDGVSEADARSILGENAISVYGLDGSVLSEVAARIGPAPERILGHRDEVEEQLVLYWNRTNGLDRPPSFDETWSARAVDEDAGEAVLARA